MKAFVFLGQRYTTVPLCALAFILAVLFGASSFAQESTEESTYSVSERCVQANIPAGAQQHSH
jgi:hypothetical protein